MLSLLNRLYFRLPVYFWLVIVVYSAVVLANLWGTQHLFFNLEPYPDSFTYIMPAWSASQGQGFVMRFADRVQIPSIFSAYSIVLAGFFLFWRDVKMVVITNLLLGWSAVVFLYLAARELKFSPPVIFSILVLYCLHGLVVWVAGLPMTENLALTTLLGGTWLALRLRHDKRIWILGLQIVILMLLFFSRLSMMPVALALGSMSAVACWQNKQRQSIVWLLVAAIVSGGIFLQLQSWMSEDALRVARAISQSNDQTHFYSLSFIVPNILFYLRSYVGQPQFTMWLTTAITSALLFITAIAGIALKIWQKSYFVALVLLAGWSSQLVTLLLFYHADNRYLIGTIPFLVLGVGLSLEYVLRRWHWKSLIAVVAVLILSLLWSQKNLYTVLIVDNFLRRTSPWQYQAVEHLREVVPAEATLVTALPPYLFALYGPTNFTILPVSEHQEYISKQRPIWGEEINYSDLAAEITDRLKTGASVYLTNSYITHLHEVVSDYEILKTKFELKLMAEGCLGACNVYQLRLLPEELDSFQ